ncbi:MAG: GNAT family N-acetyltransferase [Planctomycetes bacterium]|nr:GNAT family N-acetyltransferase [Planctomycetota bacterium]
MITVSATSSERIADALSLLFSRLPAEEHQEQIKEAQSSIERGDLALEGLLSATCDGELVGVALFVMQPDLTAYVWPPVIVENRSEFEIGHALLEELKRRIDAAGAWLGQCLVEPEAAVDREILNKSGFLHLADLRYLCRRVTDPLPPRSPIEFQTQTYDPLSKLSRERFATLLERTYVGTRDCPGLNGLRTGDEALDSHALVGEFDPLFWKVYRVDSDDVGVLLFGNLPERNAWEVAYMGVVPEHRGKGYSKGMMQNGLHEAAAAGCDTVLLAVDSQNHYAGRVYEDLGFSELAQRSVHVHTKLRHGIDE